LQPSRQALQDTLAEDEVAKQHNRNADHCDSGCDNSIHPTYLLLGGPAVGAE